jgi:predicted nucleic-acid-binding Zn-ribbon protein
LEAKVERRLGKAEEPSLSGDIKKLREAVRICPKCNGEMESAFLLKASKGFGAKEVYIGTQRSGGLGDKIVPFFCKNCGYIELYRVAWG